jgi:hypothetical protein
LRGVDAAKESIPIVLLQGDVEHEWWNNIREAFCDVVVRDTATFCKEFLDRCIWPVVTYRLEYDVVSQAVRVFGATLSGPDSESLAAFVTESCRFS